MLRFEQVLGNTWFLELEDCCIPVYRLRPKEVILIDTGTADIMRGPLLHFLKQEGLLV